MPEKTEEPNLIYDIGYGIAIRRNTVNYFEGDLTVAESSIWGLLHDGTEINALKFDGGTLERSKLVKEFDSDIKSAVGDRLGEWIRKENSEDNQDKAPWERIGKGARGFSLTHTCDDDGNANRFEDECRGWLIFDRVSKEWFSWRQNHWESANEDVGNAARFVGRSVDYEKSVWVKYPGTDELKPEYITHVKRSASLQSQKAMLVMAQTRMTVDLSQASDKSLIACKNGIIDSTNGEFYPLWECDQFRWRYPTVYIDCEYTSGAKSPEWVKHLKVIMDDNTTEGLADVERSARKYNLAAYLLRLFGYALYPGNPERVFVFFWGKGRNGKSTTTSVVQNILGTQAASPTLSQLYASDSDRPAPSVAVALPLRLAIFSEADGDAPISTSAFKELTGEQASSRWRMMHQNNVQLPILCLPIGTTNEIPQFDKPVDAATLNRLVTIPFRHVFPEEKRDVTKEILGERDKIFSMMVDELRNYLRDGLLTPHNCARATQQELLVGEDMYKFFTTKVSPTDGARADERMTRQELKDLYLAYCQFTGAEVETRTIRNENDILIRVMTKGQITKLLNGARIMGFQESVYVGQRYFKMRRANDRQTSLNTLVHN